MARSPEEAPADAGRGVGARVAEIVRAFFAERPAGDEEAGRRAPGSALDGAIKTITASLDRWRSAGGLLRFTQAGGRDRLCAVGTPVELAPALDPITRLRADRARIRLGDAVIGEVAIRGPTLTIMATPGQAGVFPVIVDALDRRGRVVAWGQAREAPIVQVIADTPVAAVDAELLFGEPPRDLSPLRELGLRGWSLCYFDLHPSDRQAAIREALTRHGLPRGAILVHPASDVEFKTLGIDFHRLFAATRIRRIRADGAPLVLMVSDESRAWASAGADDGVASVDLPGLTLCLREDGGLDPWVRAAVDFCRRRAASSPLAWRLDALTGAAAVAGNLCEIELDNRRARERLFALIEGAKRSVHLQVYILSPGVFSERLAARLIRAARAGVAVRLIVDALFSTQDVLGMTNPVAEGLAKEPGIELVAASPISTADRLEVGAFKRRNHRKIIIIDGTVALVGGRNCSDEYYTGFDEVAITDWTPHERVPWLDAHVELAGPLVAAVQRSFIATWRAGGGAEVADDEVFPALAEVGTTAARLVLHEGLIDTNTLGAYEALIESAADHVYILNDYPILASLRDDLLRALARGVRVVILTGSAVARRGDGRMLRGPLSREIFEYMTKHRLEPLIVAGAEVYEFATPPLPEIVVAGGVVRPYVHAKVMSADGVAASVGSANLDVTASYWEHEANVVIEDPAVVGALEAQIDALVAGSHRLDLESEYWRREARQREISSTLWPETLYS